VAGRNDVIADLKLNASYAPDTCFENADGGPDVADNFAQWLSDRHSRPTDKDADGDMLQVLFFLFGFWSILLKVVLLWLWCCYYYCCFD
jgi:hypothetical protein